MKDDQFVGNGGKKRILVCAESLRINETSSGIVTSTFVSMLHRSGFEVDVLSQKNFSYDVVWLNDVPLYLFQPIELSGNFFRKIPKIRAIFPLFEKANPMLNPLIKQWRNEINSRLHNKKYDLIIALGSGAMFYPHFALAALKPSEKWVANFHDPFPMHTYPFPYKHKKGVNGWLLQRRVHEIMKQAWKITFPSAFLQKSMLEHYPEIFSKSFVIPHIGTHLQNLPEFVDDKNLQLEKGKINIVHAGTLLGPRNPTYLLTAIKEFNLGYPALSALVNFIFIGKVASELKSKIADSSLSNVLFFDGRISYKRSLEVISEADGLIVIEAINDFSPFMPGKLADISYYEKPILALTCKNSEVMRLLGSNYPYSSELDDVSKMKMAIVRLIGDLESGTVEIDAVLSLKKYCSVEANGVLIGEKLFEPI